MEYFSFRAACLSWAFRAQPSIETAPTTGFSMERCVPRTKAKTRTKPLHIFSAFCVLGSQLKSSCQSASAWVHLARAPHPKAAQGLSPHIQCKPDCGKIITSLCWLFFFSAAVRHAASATAKPCEGLLLPAHPSPPLGLWAQATLPPCKMPFSALLRQGHKFAHPTQSFPTAQVKHFHWQGFQIHPLDASEVKQTG